MLSVNQAWILTSAVETRSKPPLGYFQLELPIAGQFKLREAAVPLPAAYALQPYEAAVRSENSVVRDRGRVSTTFPVLCNKTSPIIPGVARICLAILSFSQRNFTFRVHV